MPSADDRCASCGCAPLAHRDHVADGRDARDIRAEQIVDDDVAAIELRARLSRAEPVRHRTAAGGDEQLLDRQRSLFAAASCISIVTCRLDLART
jgi:hypothetical protein